MLISLRILTCFLRVSCAIFWARWNPWGCWCGSFIIRTHQLRRSRLSLPAGLQRCDRALSWELRKLLRASLMTCTMMIRWMVAKSWVGGKHPTIYRVSAIPNWFCLGFGWPIHSIIYTCTKDHGVNPQDPTGSTCGLGVCNPTSHVSHLWSFCRSNHRSSWGSIIFLHSWCVGFPWVLPISKLLCWVG